MAFNTSNEGYLELILGPMFSGKTTKLVNLYHKYVKLSYKVIAINYFKDTRYSDEQLSTHDNIMIPCIFANSISSTLDRACVKEANVILINEGQFFDDILESTLFLIEKMNKQVFVCGLDGDFKRQKFGNLLDLLPYSDELVKLKSICKICKNHAIFSHRISKESEQLVIGSDNYVPLCRKCYMHENENK